MQNRILIVDDHPGTSKTLALAFADLGNDYDVIAATSGYEALEMMSINHVDVLITDLMMPGMSGLELFEKLQAHPGGRPSFNFLITAYDIPGLKETARRLNINKVLLKPFNPEELVQTVWNLIQNLPKIEKPAEPIEKISANILVADDQPDNRTLLGRYMDAEGYQHIFATDGKETLEMALKKLPDLILLDVNMPKLDGFEVLEKLRKDPRTRFTPVIIFTAARLHPEDVQKGFNLGADDYMTKPFDRHELIARIRAKLRIKKEMDLLRSENNAIRTLPQFGRDLNASGDARQFANTLLEHSSKVTGASHAQLVLLDRDGKPANDYMREKSSAKLSVPSKLIEHIGKNRDFLAINDGDTKLPLPQQEGSGLKSFGIAPLWGQSKLLGVLVLAHELVNYFNSGSQYAIEIMANHAAIVLESMSLQPAKAGK